MESTMKRTKPEGMNNAAQDGMCKTPLKESKKQMMNSQNDGTASNVSTGEKEKRKSKKQMKKIPMKGIFGAS